MLVSTKGRYAIRILIDIAENSNGSYVTLQEIAKRQEISKKYMESIMSILVKHNLIESSHGKGGGYRLNKAPEQYTVLEIIESTEESLAPVSCLKENAEICPRSPNCSTLSMWKEIHEIITKYFQGKTIADLMHKSSFDINKL